MSVYDQLRELRDEPRELFDRAAQQLAARGEWHRLFDLRLIETRHRLGLPLELRGGIAEAPADVRDELEAGYLAACREVGQLLLDKGRFRESWMYLRPTGEKELIREHLARVVPDDDNAEELIELSLYEGIDPERGFAWQLGRQGTCNSITTLDGLHAQLEPEGAKACAAVLLRHVYGELRGNLRGHLHRLTGETPGELSVVELIDQHPQLMAGGSYHLDASHLGSTVRFARLLTQEELLRKAIELCRYGEQLPKDLQYPGEAPFEDVFPTHKRLFLATLGEEVDEAVEYFTSEARREAKSLEGDGATAFGASTAAIETLLILLTRVGRYEEAMDAYAEYAPADRQLSAPAPTLLDMAHASGAWDRYLEICQSRDDLLGYATGQAAQEKSSRSA